MGSGNEHRGDPSPHPFSPVFIFARMLGFVLVLLACVFGLPLMRQISHKPRSDSLPRSTPLHDKKVPILCCCLGFGTGP